MNCGVQSQRSAMALTMESPSPRLIDGSIKKTRDKYHGDDGVNLYGKVINGVMPGQGVD